MIQWVQTFLEVNNHPTLLKSVGFLDWIFSVTGSANLMLSITSNQVRDQLDDKETCNIFLHIYYQTYVDAQDRFSRFRDGSNFTKLLDAYKQAKQEFCFASP